jgi:TonB-dependent SusC/RagA subfamily outer membrane receptor
LLGKPVENVEVTVMSLGGRFFNTTKTDKEGRFWLPMSEFPDSTRFVVSAEQKRGMTNLELIIDKDIYPEITKTAVPPAINDEQQLVQYSDKAEQQYIFGGGNRVTLLPTAVASAERKSPRTSPYYSRPDHSLTEDELEKIHATSMVDLLDGRFANVRATGSGGIITGIYILRGRPLGRPLERPLLLVDNIPVEIGYLNMISHHDIAQIDILKGANASIYGMRGTNGVIVIYTKTGSNTTKITTQPLHFKALSPLGYQQPVEFYAPKYETEAQRSSHKPDLRTTIHWHPVVQTDSLGVASFEFYTADERTSYTVIIEGLADDGTIIRKEEKIKVSEG